MLAIQAGVVRRSGVMGLKMENFVIVMTGLRIIFAFQTNQMLQDNVMRARDEAKQQGKGFFGQWGAQLSANTGQHYLQMHPEQILAEHPNNFHIPANQLRRIRLHEHDDDEGGRTTYTIEFETPGGKYKYDVNYMNTRSVKKLLTEIYGNIVK